MPKTALLQALDASRSGIATADSRGRVTYVNQTTLTMWGLTREEEAIGRDVFSFWADPTAAAELAGKFSQGEHLVAELRARRADGSEFDVELSGTRVTTDDGLHRVYFASFVDITEQRRAERQVLVEQDRTRAIVDHTLDIVMIFDAEGRITFENAAVERVLGYQPGERWGHNILEYGHPDDLSSAQAGLAGLMTDPSQTARVTMRFRHKDGGWRWLETQGHNLCDDPAIRGILGVARDVTEQRQLQARAEATDRLETVGRLAGGLAHDFNNLLTAILGNAELAERTTNAGEIQRHISGIVSAAERGRELTRKLLGFSRLEHARPVTFDLRRRLLDAQELISRLLGEHITIQTTTGDADLHVTMDPVQFDQVVMNLAVNARDAMPGGGTFTVTVEPMVVSALDPAFIGAVAPGPVVRLRFADSGTGMSSDVASRVFEPFFTTKENGRGTGLGLSTVYGSVIAAGGAIRVRTAPNAGTTFDILLPRVQATAVVIDDESPMPVGRLSGLVLLAEDDAAVRHLMQEVLVSGGCRVLTARNGAQGITLANRHSAEIAVLVTDVVMPDVSGPELATHFRQLKPEGRIIFVTGYAPDPSLLQQAVALGAIVLQKPFRVDHFLSEVAHALRTD
jgi:two-component system cell cycle sensor histidine kinase/response regulator CckA